MPDPVTPQSLFRDLGNTGRAAFRAALTRSMKSDGQPSPLAPEADAIYDALAPLGLTRLAAAMAWNERSNETNPADLQYYGRELHNAWAVKNPPPHQAARGLWRRYASYAAAAVDWGAYILGPTFADLATLGELIARYAPWADGNDPARYGRTAAAEIDALPRESEVGSRRSEDETSRAGEQSRRRAGEEVTDMTTTQRDIPARPTSDSRLPTPVLYDLRDDTHAARFGLSADERDRLMGKCYPGRNGRRPEVIVVHVQWGWTAGSLRHWLGTPASATVMVQGDGSLLRMIGEADAPWTNGDVANPDASARALMDRFGRDLNPVSLTVEAEDGRTTKINAAQTETILWQIRAWQRIYPWLTADRILGHYQINAATRATCGRYRDEIVRLLGAARPLPAPPTFAGLPAWLPPEFFPATFPLADPEGVVTKALIEWIAAHDRLPWFREKIDVAPGQNLWAFDLVTFLNDGEKVWLAGKMA